MSIKVINKTIGYKQKTPKITDLKKKKTEN